MIAWGMEQILSLFLHKRKEVYLEGATCLGREEQEKAEVKNVKLTGSIHFVVV